MTLRLIVALATLLVVLLLAPWSLSVVGVVVMVVFLGWLFTAAPPVPDLRVLPVTGIAAIVAGVALGASFFIDPPRAATVDISTVYGQDIRGDRVVMTGDAYYVATGSREIIGVPPRQIERVRVRQVEPDLESVVELVTGWELY